MSRSRSIVALLGFVVLMTVVGAQMMPSVQLTVLTPGSVTTPTEFAVSLSDPEARVTGWVITYGDGSQESGPLAPPATLTHQYPTAGDYTPTLVLAYRMEAVASASVSVSDGPHGYFDALSTLPSRHVAYSLRDQAQLDL